LPSTRASAGGRFTTECDDKPSSSTVTIELKVVKADSVGGDWRATRLAGRLIHSELAQGSCVPSAATLSFTARLLT
jgi:hypothetical protein